MISSGGTIKEAKRVLEKNFPSAKGFVYTGVLARTPYWYGDSKILGVYDLESILPYANESRNYLRNYVPDTFVSKSYQGIKEHLPKQVARRMPWKTKEQQDRVNLLRSQLSYLSKKIAGNVSFIPKGQQKIEPQFLGSLNFVLNGR